MYKFTIFKNYIIFLCKKMVKKTKILTIKMNKKYKNKNFQIKNYKLRLKNKKF